MLSEEKEPLSKQEYDKIGNLLLDLVKGCPSIPEKVPVQYQSIDTVESIGIYTLPGAKYLKRNVIGGFTAQIKFQIAYRSFPTSNNQRINSQAKVDTIMNWLEEYGKMQKLSGGRTITKITASNSLPYKDNAGGDKSTIFAADAVMEYEKD